MSRSTCLLGLVLAAGCGGGEDAFDGAVALTIIPDDFDMALDRTVKLQVALRNEAGDYFAVDEATYQFDPSRISIEEVPGAEAVAPTIAEPLVTGDVSFTAAAEGLTGRATFHVLDRRPPGGAHTTLAVGDFEACFIGTDDLTYCIEANLTPVQRSTEPFVSLTSSAFTTCGLRADGIGICGIEASAGAPTQMTGSGYVAIASGRDGGLGYYCGVGGDGTVNCDVDSPLSIHGNPVPRAAGISQRSRCIITSGYQAYCMPTRVNDFEDLGQQGNNDGAPTAYVYGNYFWRALTDGERFTCGITLDDQGFCWGRDDQGELGIDPSAIVVETCASATPCVPYPVPIAGDHRWAVLTAGERMMCGLDLAGKAYCWGGGYLGGGTTPMLDGPLTVVAGGHVFEQLDVGARFSCATTAAGELWCWGLLPGSNPGQQVLEPVKVTTPVPVKTPT